MAVAIVAQVVGTQDVAVFDPVVVFEMGPLVAAVTVVGADFFVFDIVPFVGASF